MKPHVHVIIPAYDCLDALRNSVYSVASQDYAPMTVVISDDASPSEAQRAFVAESGQRPGWTSIQRTERVGALRNIHEAIIAANPKPEDIIVLVDGDDWLEGQHAISTIAAAYHDPNVWLTYGSYRTEPPTEEAHPAEPYPAEVIANRTFRDDLLRFNHPLSFKGFLWAELGPDDFTDDDGNWLFYGYDEAIMYPLLEVAGEHHRHLTDTLYVYNAANPISQSRLIDHDPRVATDSAIHRSRPRRDPMMKLDGALILDSGAKARIVADAVIRYGGPNGFLVETGTHLGDTPAIVRQEVPGSTVWTIEADRAVYQRAKQRFADDPNVTVLHGNSPEVIRAISASIPYAVWWLDAHIDDWKHVNPRRVQVTPILDELDAVIGRKQGEPILIDDVRLFGFARGYPALADLIDHIRRVCERYDTSYTHTIRHDIMWLTEEP